MSSFLPLAGLEEGSVQEFFKLVSVWAETAHSQLPTPRGYWQALIFGSKVSWDLPSKEHEGPLLVGLGVTWIPGTRLSLGGTPSPIGSVSGSGLSRAWVVFEPPPPPATEGVGPGIGI